MAQDLFTQLAQQTLANISTEGPAEVGDDPVSAIYQVAQERGIDPANLLGLAKLETQAGAKTVKGGGADTRNLFNVKDFSKDGSGIRARDKAEGSNDRYRTYGSYRESVEDLASLLERRYPGAAKAGSPEAFARELKRGGYATDPAYESKLARVIRSSGGAARPVDQPQEWDQGARYAPVGVTIAGTDKPQPAAKGEPEGIVSSMGNAVWQGAKSLGRSVMASGNTAVGDLSDVELLAAAQRQDARNDPQAMQALKSEIEVRKKANPGAKWWQALGDVGDAAWQNKLGTAQLIANQAPNSAVALGGGWAGGVAGAKLGALAAPFTGGLSVPVGATVGALAGMFLGNYAMESGGKAIEKAEGGFTQDEANTSMTEGAKKAAVVTGVDALTLGAGKMVGRTVFGAPVRAGARAEAQVLADAGVDITSKAAIAQALATNQALKQTAIEAGKQAAKGASKVGTRVAQAGTGMTMETLGEGTGEYFGEEWATGKGDIYDAALEALSSATQSVPQTAIAMAKSSSNELDPSGIVRAAKQSGGIVSRAGLAATPGAQQPNPAAPNQPATNPGAAAATVPTGNAGNTAAASTAPNPYFDGVTDEALANMGQFMATRQTMTDGTPITEADRQVGRDALAELQRRRLAAKANPQPAAAQTPTQASALSAIEQALEADKQRRRAAGEVVEDEVEEDDVVAAQPAATTAQPAAAPAAPIQPAVKPPLSDERDAMLPQAIDLLRQGVRPSVAAIQGQLRIGFNRAARILEEMERDGVVGPMDAQGARQILKLPDPPDAQATTPAQPASAGFSSPKFDNSPIPKMDPAEAAEQRRVTAEFEQKRKNRRAGTRSAAWERNPFLAFLGANGLNRDTASEFAPGLTERRKAFVPGYGPVFRPGAKSLDELVQAAKEDGFLRDDDGEPELYDLIDRALRGERIAPLFADGAAEAEGKRRQQEMLEREGATYDDYLQQHSQAIEADDFDPLESIGASGYDFGDSDMDGYAAAPAPLQAEVAALSQHYYDLGFDPDEVLERLSIETENQPEQAYYDLAKSRFTQLIEQALSPGRAEGSAEQGSGGAVRQHAGPQGDAQANGGAAGSQAAAVTPPAAPAVAQPRRADAIRAKLDDLKAQGFSQFTRSSGRTLLLNPDTYETVELTPAEMVVAKAASGQARSFATAIEKTKTGWAIKGDPEALAQHARDLFGKGVVKRKDGISLATKTDDVAGNFPARYEDYRLAGLPERHGRIEVRVNQDGSASVRSLDGGYMGPKMPSVAEAVANHRKEFGDGDSGVKQADAQPASSMAAANEEAQLKTVRDVADKLGMEYVSGLLADSLKKGQTFSLQGKQYTVTAVTDSRIRLKSSDGKTIEALKYGNKLVSSGNAKSQPYAQFVRDLEGVISVDLINESNPFHRPSEVFVLAQKALDALPADMKAVRPESAAGAGNADQVETGREGYDTPVELDAAQLKAILEQTRGEPLVDKPAKLEAWRNGTAKTDPAKFPIELVFRPDGRLDVNDGRHRIALAAERGEKVTAFIDGKDAQRAKDLLAMREQQTAASGAVDADLEAIFDQLDGITQRTQAAGQQAAAAHPQAERIQFVQKHILDILEDLEDGGKVTINC